MRRLALRSLAAHKGRLAMTLAAVCLGTAFVAGTMLFSASAERAGLDTRRHSDVALRDRCSAPTARPSTTPAA